MNISSNHSKLTREEFKALNLRVIKTKKAIEKVCIENGLNLMVYNGKIAFVDQENLVAATWEPCYSIADLMKVRQKRNQDFLKEK